MLSVILPVYNRLENFKLCMLGLEHQLEAPEFEIIVVDDGSTDKLMEWLYETHEAKKSWKLPSVLGFKTKDFDIPVSIRYLSGGPNKGFRGGRARNIGAFNANGERFVFIDSDVVLNEFALRHYGEADKLHPDTVIVGAYHWLPPLDWPAHAELLYTATGFYELLDQAKALDVKQLGIDNDSPFGEDIRFADFTDNVNGLTSGAGLGALSGNISYPAELFEELGGFDERIIGHGGEDADLGLTADSRNAGWLFYRPIFGFHVWHPRDQAKNSIEVQANIAFIDAKHGVGQYAGAKKWTDSQDWSDPIHYHKHLGSLLIKTVEDAQVYVYREGKYIRLSSPEWMLKLGFTWNDLEIVTKSFIESAQHCGDTFEPEVQQTGIVQETQSLQPVTREVDFDIHAMTSYHREHRTGLVRLENEQTVYVVRDNKRVAISNPDWIPWFGFIPDDVAVVPPYAFEGIEIVGATPGIEQLITGRVGNVV